MIATIHTHLNLSRFARIFGLNPVHFCGAVGETYWPIDGGCNDVWRQWSWQQNGVVTREDLSQAIHDAEEDIKRVLGYPVAPEWITAEEQPWPKFHDPTFIGGPITATGIRHKTIQARNGKILAAGVRAVTLIDDAVTVTYSDPDGDGFDELATVTTSSTLTDVNEIKVYHPGKAGNPVWELRPVRSKTANGTTVTITFDSWNLLDPALYDAVPTSAGIVDIDIEDSDNFLATVDLYRETTVNTTQSQFIWETGPYTGCLTCGGAGCSNCSLTTQNGCLLVRGSNEALLTPLPATYADSTWTPAYFSVNREPDRVKLWYLAGAQAEEYVAGYSLDPLSHYLAQAIAWMAVARLEADPCGCGRVEEQWRALRKDLAEVERSVGTSFVSVRSTETITNPFGTREGEVRAWNRVARLMARD